MAVLKLKYKRNGKVKTINRWYVDFTDNNGINRRMPGYLDKAATTALEGKIKDLVGAIREDLPIKVSELSRWFADNADTKIRNTLSGFGLLEAAAGPKSLLDLVQDFIGTMLVSGKKKYTSADLAETRIKGIVAGCGFKTWADVNADSVNLFIHNMEARPQTKKDYVAIFRRFARWIADNGHGANMPKLVSVKVPDEPKRWFEQDEYMRLLEAAKTGPTFYESKTTKNIMTGYERYVCYWLAVETGLRCDELRALTPSHFNFSNCQVFVSGKDTKNKNAACQMITQDLSDLLRDFVTAKGPNVQLFNIPHRSAEMVRADCKAANIPEYKMPYGRIGFHSLRHTCASFYLAATNGNMQIVCKIMRHSNVMITVNRYGHMLKGEQESALEKMKKFTVPKIKTIGAAAG